MTSKRLRILEVIASADPASGGPIEGMLRMDQASRRVGVERHVVTCERPNALFLADFPMTVHALGESKPGAVSHSLLTHYGYTPHLIPWLKAHARDYDAVIVNGLWNYATFAAAMTLPGGRTPYFVFTHGMMDPWFRRQSPLKHLAKQAFWTFCEGRLLAGARAVLFTTEEERRLARGQFFGWQYREAVVGYGTAAPPPPSPKQVDAFRAAAPALGERPFLLFLSRIHPKKGCDMLVEAFAQVAAKAPSLDLLIAGPDQVGLMAKLQAQAQRLGVADRIHWTGPLYGEAKWGAMRSAQAFILPSHQENFGIVVAEALACGTPVLITDKVNIWQEVHEGGAGLVAADTLAGTERLLQDWLTLTAEARATMRGAAKATFVANFDVTRTAPRVIDLVREAT
jgi:glycosyltransferase involved in cell wall biosynthesis